MHASQALQQLQRISKPAEGQPSLHQPKGVECKGGYVIMPIPPLSLEGIPKGQSDSSTGKGASRM